MTVVARSMLYTLISLIKSYLYNRTQYVFYNGFDSKQFVAASGVTQGSNLGPSLFLLFNNDLVQIINCVTVLFTVDLKLHHAVENDEEFISKSNKKD